MTIIYRKAEIGSVSKLYNNLIWIKTRGHPLRHPERKVLHLTATCSILMIGKGLIIPSNGVFYHAKTSLSQAV